MSSSALEDRVFSVIACDAFIAAAGENGIPCNDDFKGEARRAMSTIVRRACERRRVSSALAYWPPARTRSNLHRVTGAGATRICFEGQRAVGLNYLVRNRPQSTSSHREAVFSGGAMNSPQLLHRSALGPRALLERHGISPVLDAPGASEGLQDHIYVCTLWKCTQSITFNDDMASLMGSIAWDCVRRYSKVGP